MKKSLALFAAVAVIAAGVGCPAFSTVLSDVSGTITRFAPLLGVAEGVVCVVNGPACGAVETFTAIAEPLASKLSTAFTAWSTASSTAAPGKLNQVIAALETWQTQLQGGFTVPGLSAAQQAQYDPMIEAELNASADLLTTLQAAEQAGGTPAALAQVIDEATPLDSTESLDDYMAFITVGKVFRLVRAPRTFRLKNGAVVHTWAYHKAQLIEKMSKPTGDKQIDAWRGKCIDQIKKLG